MEPYYIFHFVYVDDSEEDIWTRDEAEAYYIANDAQQNVDVKQIHCVKVIPASIAPFPGK